MKWRQREIENYLCYPETLIGYAEQASGEAGPLFEAEKLDRQRTAMREAMNEVTSARAVLGLSAPFSPDIEASDEFLAPVFQKYFEKLGIRNLMQKTDYHTLARFVPKGRLDIEISEKLDSIVEVARRARPVE